jgi:sugar fermentation stimulation protein A
MVGQGHRSMLVFCVQHAGAKTVGLADEIDPYYAQVMQQALSAGVEVIAYSCMLSPEEIAVEKRLPFIL